jgi:hypothetical protein
MQTAQKGFNSPYSQRKLFSKMQAFESKKIRAIILLMGWL